jgi:CAAX prenyl protease-like protein
MATTPTAEVPRPAIRISSFPYVFPFVLFIAFLAVAPYLTGLGEWEYPLRVIILGAVTYITSRHVIEWRVRNWLLTASLGVAVFVLWIAPDMLVPGYRDHWLFQNALTGKLNSTLAAEHRDNWVALSFRIIRAAVLVPIIEELFWRAWLLRWLQAHDFSSVPPGRWTWSAMLITVALFASEHGPYWDVGIMAGFAYNWLYIRTKSLADCIFAHAITNACLGAWVIATARWEYWM